MRMSYIFYLLFIPLCIFLSGCNHNKDKKYKVKYYNREITIDGILEKQEWKSANSINGLSAPWDTVGLDETLFRSFCTDEFFYFCFNVKDTELIICDFEDELSVAKEDRVEIFFDGTSDMSQYYCIEIDPLGRILDYSAQYYRKFDEQWDFTQVKISSRIMPQGYVIEGSIPLRELRRLGLKESIYMGIFRADFRKAQTDDVVWYTWIIPQSTVADFHIPSALGICKFENL